MAFLPSSVFIPPSFNIRLAWFEISWAFLGPFFLAISVSGFLASIVRNVWMMVLFIVFPVWSSFCSVLRPVSKGMV